VLLAENRAIVSNIPGTTRDTIEEELIIEGIKFKIIDTAGIRHTDDKVEYLGIQRTFEKAAQSAIVLYLFDKSNTNLEEVVEDYTQLKTETNEVIICPTKIDLYTDYNWEDTVHYIKAETSATTIIGISAITHQNIELLKGQLVLPYISNIRQTGETIIVNQRHLAALQQAAIALQQSHSGLESGLSGDLVSIHLKDAIKHIGSITGQVDVDKDILGTIFSKFCIGK
jgi:tRNA modification GTPase